MELCALLAFDNDKQKAKGENTINNQLNFGWIVFSAKQFLFHEFFTRKKDKNDKKNDYNNKHFVNGADM